VLCGECLASLKLIFENFRQCRIEFRRVISLEACNYILEMKMKKELTVLSPVLHKCVRLFGRGRYFV
jgi:hypothetical protein